MTDKGYYGFPSKKAYEDYYSDPAKYAAEIPSMEAYTREAEAERASLEPAMTAEKKMTQPRVTDNDKDEITVSLDGRDLRGWSYRDDAERRTKMLAAREYVEGWCDGRDAR